MWKVIKMVHIISAFLKISNVWSGRALQTAYFEWNGLGSTHTNSSTSRSDEIITSALWLTINNWGSWAGNQFHQPNPREDTFLQLEISDRLIKRCLYLSSINTVWRKHKCLLVKMLIITLTGNQHTSSYITPPSS